MSDSGKHTVNLPKEKEEISWASENQSIATAQTSPENNLNNIKYLINGLELKQAPVSDLVDIDKKASKISVEVSDNALEAYINYIPSLQVLKTLNPAAPAVSAEIKANELSLYTSRLKKEAIYTSLRNHGILYGIIPEKVEEICSLNKPGKYLIAKALLPVDPVDDILELCFEDKNDYTLNLKENASGKIDYKNSHKYTYFKPGELIAKIYKGDEGTMGINVKGMPIPYKERRKLTLLPNGSIHIEETENIIFIRAARSGKPFKTITSDGKLSLRIVNKLVLENVNIKTGNVNFNGDMEVLEDIQEAMKVVVKNNINVKGNVFFSTVFCGNSVRVEKGVISSKIISGTNLDILNEFIPTITRFISDLENLINNMRFLSAAEVRLNKLTNVADVINYLIKTKNSSILPTIQSFVASFKEEKFDLDSNLLYIITKKLKAIATKSSGINHINFIYGLISDLKNLLKIKPNGIVSGDIHVESVLNSEFTASGNIIIKNSCINSNIYAKENISIKGNIRGGEIFAEKKIIAGKVGSDLGIRSTLAVAENGVIVAKTIYPDITVKIGNVIYKFLNEVNKVTITAVDGKINIE